MSDQVQEKEFDLTFIEKFFALLEKLEFHVPVEGTERFELCQPEFQNLKTQLGDAMARREHDVSEYAPVLAEAMTAVSAILCF